MKFEFASFRLEFRFSFFAVLALMQLLCEERVTFVCFVSSILHECGHLCAMLLFGCRLRSVCFGAAGIVIERQSPYGVSACGEVCIALGGVFVNLLLCAAAFLAARKSENPLFYFALFANALLAALNLIPVYPLDAARALCAFLQNRIAPDLKARVLRIVSLAATGLVIGGSAVYTIFISWNVSLLAVCVYLTVLNLKRSTTDV